MTVLAVLPLIVLGLLAAALRCGRAEDGPPLREDLLRAALAVGVSISLGTELLGAFHAITFAGILAFWLAALAAAALFFDRRRHRLGPPLSFRFPLLSGGDRALVFGIAVVAILTLVVAWLSPPQSPDSISYHMGRVMHWIQNHSLDSYPAHDTRQLFDPPFAEIVRLHFQLLTGSDRAGCLIQWFAATGTLFAATLVARDLRGNRRAQLFAAVFVITLPIGITQATSGKNDWVEAFWLLALVHFSGSAMASRRDGPVRRDLVLAGAALGLAIATKLTAWVFAPPFLVVALARTPRANLRRLAAPAAAAALLVFALIAPSMRRTREVFGNLVSEPVYAANNGVGRVTPAIFLSDALRDLAFQFGSRSEALNRSLDRFVVSAHRIIGADPSDPQTSVEPFFIPRPPTVEEAAGSPLQILLLAAAGLFVLIRRRLPNRRQRLFYLAALCSGFALFCATVRWSPSTCRFLMPLLVLAAPLVAAVAGDVVSGRAVSVFGAILFAGCAPSVVATNARPLSFEPGRGILATPRIDLYFARARELKETYRDVARRVRAEGVRNLGVVVTRSIQPEYLLWILLHDVRPPIRIENVLVPNASAMLESSPPFRDYRPDLIVAFDGAIDHPVCAPEVVVGDTRYPLVGASGSAGFYARRPSPAVVNGER